MSVFAKQLLLGVAGPTSGVTDNAVARWDGITGKLVQGSGVTIDDNNNISGIGFTDMSEVTVPPIPAADTLRLFVEDYKGFSFYSFKDSTGMVRKIVRDSVFVGKNVTGSPIALGRIVYASGTSDDVPTIALAQADVTATMPAIGVTVEAIADGDFGRVMQVGLLESVNTLAFSVGDVFYVSGVTAGIPTITPPVYPNLRQEIGTVLVDSATSGAIQIVARTAHNDALVDHTGLLNIGTNTHAQIDTHVARDGSDSILLGVGATTFAVTKNVAVVTGDGGGNTVATITGGVDGQLLTLLFTDVNVVITDDDTHGADSIDLSAAFTSADDTILQLVYDGTSWYETSRSVN